MKDMIRKYTTKKSGRAWEWFVRQGGKCIAGGYCRTLKDARNDLAIWRRDHPEATKG